MNELTFFLFNSTFMRLCCLFCFPFDTVEGCRIREWFGFEETLKSFSSNPTAVGRDT